MQSKFDSGYATYIRNIENIKKTVNPIAALVYRLHFYFNEHKLGIGTGFFWRSMRGLCLLTNWHNVSGLHHIDRTLLDRKTAAMPNKARVFFYDDQHDRFRYYDFDLYTKDGSPGWHVHAVCGSFFDVVAIFLNFPDFSPRCLNDEVADLPVQIRPPNQVYALGYPQSISNFAAFPVWKSGIVATEPSTTHNGLPLYLIDLVGRSGMSGGPVIYKTRDIVWPFTAQIRENFPQFGFSGMYGGRINGDRNAEDSYKSSELGIVWNREIVFEVANNGVIDEMPEPLKGIIDISISAVLPSGNEKM